MALLTAEEQKKLAKEGIGYGIKEKCDACGKPFMDPTVPKHIVNGKDLCLSCWRKTKSEKFLKRREEKEMARNKKADKEEKNGSNKVGGYLIAESCVADLYLALEDEKKHPLSEVKKIAAKHKSELTSRLGRLRRVGLRKKAWAIIVDREEGTVQMKLGKPSASVADSSPKKSRRAKDEDEDEKPAKKVSKANGKVHDDDDAGDSSSKAERVAATIIRRTLKSKKDWTRNKLVEHLVDEQEMDADVVKAALNHEIKTGGIEVDDGVLSLA